MNKLLLIAAIMAIILPYQFRSNQPEIEPGHYNSDETNYYILENKKIELNGNSLQASDFVYDDKVESLDDNEIIKRANVLNDTNNDVKVLYLTSECIMQCIEDERQAIIVADKLNIPITIYFNESNNNVIAYSDNITQDIYSVLKNEVAVSKSNTNNVKVMSKKNLLSLYPEIILLVVLSLMIILISSTISYYYSYNRISFKVKMILSTLIDI